MEKRIVTNQLTKQYKSQPEDEYAIQGISFEVPKGQLFGLIGPDGAGKTTTIRILSSVMAQTDGDVFVAGYNLKSDSGKARPNIGYMPQAFSLYPDLSVIENLNFFADIQDVPGSHRKERVEELLAFTRLDRFQKRRSEHLSGGMRKKLALACALIHEPKVLLLDEPTTGVDPVSRRELWRILAEVILQGVTVLVSTPYMDEAERCHQVGILYEGEILTAGTPAELESELPFEVLEVKAMPRRISRQVIRNTEGIRRWRPVGDRMRLIVDQPQQMQKALITALKRAGAEVNFMRQAKKTMEDVFIHLVETQRGVK